MKIAIVGVDGAKALGHEQAIDDLILTLLQKYDPTQDEFGSGEATGVDSATRRLAIGAGFKFTPFPPADGHKHWDCENACRGFKWRNLELGAWADKIYAISIKTTIQNCYHCYGYMGANNPHKVNGGCWTMRTAIREFSKGGEILVVA